MCKLISSPYLFILCYNYCKLNDSEKKQIAKEAVEMQRKISRIDIRADDAAYYGSKMCYIIRENPDVIAAETAQEYNYGIRDKMKKSNEKNNEKQSKKNKAKNKVI